MKKVPGYLVPGDLCDLDAALLSAMDHTITTALTCNVVRLTTEAMADLLDNHPQIALALRKAQLVAQATLREWLVNVGRRAADERIAHLMCELLLRLRAVGRTAGEGYTLPITQEDLADTTGLTSVHVNRMLGTLKQRGLIELSGRQLKILDLAGLEALAEFKPNYLHLGGRDAA